MVKPRDAAFAPLPDHSSASDVRYGSDGSKYTLQVALQSLVTEASATSGTSMITPNVRMAGIVIAILPLVLICAGWMARTWWPFRRPFCRFFAAAGYALTDYNA